VADRSGYLLGFSAWAMWGFFPLYWPLLEPSTATEILAHRIVWSLVVIAVVVVVAKRRARVIATFAVRRTRLFLIAAAFLITANWGTYIWGVNNGHVVETSLGYFINPLVSVMLGVLVFDERMRRLQWVAIGLAAVAVLVLTVNYGRPPWVALILAFSFALYGLVKKKAHAGAVESLAVETAVMTPLSLAYIAFLGATGASSFGPAGFWHAVLMIGTGVLTVVPLLCFSAAATRIPLSTLGLMQYVTPTLQFTLGVVVFNEPMPTVRWVGFAIIWAALALFTADVLRHRRTLRRTVQPTPA
jgi:chloramphenicol-sensitive protein RarD